MGKEDAVHYTMEYCSAIKWNAIIYNNMGNLEIMFSEISQAQKYKYCMTSKNKDSRMVVLRGSRVWYVEPAPPVEQFLIRQ